MLTFKNLILILVTTLSCGLLEDWDYNIDLNIIIHNVPKNTLQQRAIKHYLLERTSYKNRWFGNLDHSGNIHIDNWNGISPNSDEDLYNLVLMDSIGILLDTTFEYSSDKLISRKDGDYLCRLEIYCRY